MSNLGIIGIITVIIEGGEEGHPLEVSIPEDPTPLPNYQHAPEKQLNESIIEGTINSKYDNLVSWVTSSFCLITQKELFYKFTFQRYT